MPALLPLTPTLIPDLSSDALSAKIAGLFYHLESVNRPAQGRYVSATGDHPANRCQAHCTGSRHVPLTHQHLIEMMSYALVLSGNRLITWRNRHHWNNPQAAYQLVNCTRLERPQATPAVTAVNAGNDQLSCRSSAICNQEIVSAASS